MRQDVFVEEMTNIIGYPVTAIAWEYVLGEEIAPNVTEEYFTTVNLRVEIDHTGWVEASVTGTSPNLVVEYDKLDIEGKQVRVYIPESVSYLIGAYKDAEFEQVVGLMIDYMEAWACRGKEVDWDIKETTAIAFARGSVC